MTSSSTETHLDSALGQNRDLSICFQPSEKYLLNLLKTSQFKNLYFKCIVGGGEILFKNRKKIIA